MTPPDCSEAWPVVRFDEIDSTSEEARRRTARGEFGPVWFTAARQASGRGRMGREWSSPEGNLYTTCLFELQASPAEASLICFSAGLAVIEAAEMAGVKAGLRLKWPNDVETKDGAKVAGILIESGKSGDGRLWLAVGFGINVQLAPERADRKTARLHDMPGGVSLSPAGMLAALDVAFRFRVQRLAYEGFEPTRLDWLARAAPNGTRVGTNAPNGRIEGRMAGLSDDGALIIEGDDGAITQVRAGEVSVLS
jgi:BirA family biotin operon repressor/biotin-[acetyl-CoA-carboxylase] ligase